MNEGKLIKGDRYLWIYLFTLLIFGLVLIGLNHCILSSSNESLTFIIDSLALALMTAAILGLTVDVFLKKQIIGDVFAATMGYILAPDLRGEVKTLYELEFMCIEHHQVFTFRPTSTPEFVLLHKKTERTFKNITSKKQLLYPKVTVLEWFIPNMQSRIIDMGAAKGNERWTSFTVRKPSSSIPTNELVGTLDNAIELNPNGETCTIWTETEEFKRATDLHCEYFDWPTKNPSITVRREFGAGIKGKLGIRVRFGAPRRKNVEGLGRDTSRLVGILSPGQCVEIRWYMKEDAVRWIQNSKEKPSLG
jgi:hypothetical protein